MGNIISNIPGKVVALCATFLAATVLGCITFLAATGADATNVIQVVNTVINFVTLGAAGAAVSVGASAAASSSKAVQQTNGALDARIRDSVTAALAAQRETDVTSGATTYSTVNTERSDSDG